MDTIKLLHAVSGSLIGLVGLAQIVLPKKGKRHAILGFSYLLGWTLVFFTGAAIGSVIVTFFGGLGYYMVLTGWRFARIKRAQAGLFEKVLIITALVAAFYTTGYGVYALTKGATNLGIISLFLGGIFLISAVNDFRSFVLGTRSTRLTGHPLQWYFEHFGRMYISYIAAMTAFSAIQNVFGHELLNWMLPTFIGTLGIILTNRFYYKKFKIPKKRAA